MNNKLCVEVFRELAQTIFDSAEEDENGELVLSPEAYFRVGYLEFQLATLLGPEFVDQLEPFGFTHLEEGNDET